MRRVYKVSVAIVGREVRDNDVIVSTIKVSCMAWYGRYETAISFSEADNMWNIAEGYATLEEAKQGHKKYMNMPLKELERLEFLK